MDQNIPLSELMQIKQKLEEKLNETSDSDSTYITESDTSDSSSSRIKSKKNSTPYKYKYERLESKNRYMQLEMTNKDIEITELKDKLEVFNKHELITKKSNFLFERLDNAIKILTERMNTNKDNSIFKLTVINQYQSIIVSCEKVCIKYINYFNDEIIPLMDVSLHVYTKNSYELLLKNKEKELINIATNCKYKISNLNYYIFSVIVLFVITFLIIINILMLIMYWYIPTIRTLF